jgi:hypothetical protein
MSDKAKKRKTSKKKSLKLGLGGDIIAPDITADSIISSAAMALGMEDFDRAEAERFRKDVQGDRIRGINGDEEDDEVGPAPLPQPKDYADDKKVFIFFTFSYIKRACLIYFTFNTLKK